MLRCKLRRAGKAHASLARLSRPRPMPKPAIVVRGLLPTTTAETLYAAFGPAGPIKRLRLVTDEQGRSAGVAFITFQSATGVQRGLQLGEGIVIDGQRPTVGPAHREAEPDEQAQQAQHAQQGQQAQQAAGESQPQQSPRPVQQQQAQHAQQPSQQQAQHAPYMQQALSPAGSDVRYVQRRGSFNGLPAGGTGWDVQLQRAGSSPALSGLGAGPSSPGGSLGTLSSSAGEPPSNDTLFARPLAPEVDEAALRDLFGEHAGVLSVRILRLPDGSSRGCGFVRFAEPSQAQLALQALNGLQLFGRTLRLSWAHQRQPIHSLSPSVEGGGRSRSFGHSSSGDFSPTAPGLAPGAAMGMVPMLAASPGYSPVMMSPVYWAAGGMYAAPAVPAMPPGSPIPGSPVPGSPVIGSPFQFAQPMAGYGIASPMPPAALPPPAIPLDGSGSPAQGWPAQQPQWPPHWQPMPQLATGCGVPWQQQGSFQFGQHLGALGWQWQAQQQPSSQFFWDGSTIPEVPGSAAAAAPSAAARTPATTPAPAPAALSSPSSGGEASVGSAVGAVRTSPSSPAGKPDPLHGLGRLASGASLLPPGSPTPDEPSGDEWAALHGSSRDTSAQPSSSQLQASELDEQPGEAQEAAAAADPNAVAADDGAEATASGLDRLHID
ncbi:polyadenylate-binding RBP45-like [Chlorella sorokiniana]|uniref:Polyadenylate-binding RBP45-like n=1 Tax=Chlorella sorokiniana TaxID=3076 RepID=A0A2P6TNS8_CHLSO|nr:polyadenylate-binding RBP45-like [Chlorella sorokiniana]|eukprot:PRW50982.1 polyadenylate-binding RBP45-like [Chlorella sorokiniana]